MKLFICTNFKGHYPVGAGAVVVHRNRHGADALLRAELKSKGIEQDEKRLLKYKELTLDGPGVYVLVDGNY